MWLFTFEGLARRQLLFPSITGAGGLVCSAEWAISLGGKVFKASLAREGWEGLGEESGSCAGGRLCQGQRGTGYV